MRTILNCNCIAALTVLLCAVLTGCAGTGIDPKTPGQGSMPTVAPALSPPAVQKRAPKVALALGGGAARGFAHVGVIQALEAAGIKVDCVVGTSAGSLVAALWASGKNGAQLQQLADGMDEATFTDWTLPIFSRGALRGEALARYVSEATARRPIEAMPLPLGILATNLQTGEPALFRRGDTGTAVRASSSVPTVFVPVKIGEFEYVDGGLIAPVPVRFARQMCGELVLAVDISAAPEYNPTASTVQVLLQTTAIMGKSINLHELAAADVVVKPALAGAKGTDFSAKRQSIDAGRAAMNAQLPKLKAKLLELAQPI